MQFARTRLPAFLAALVAALLTITSAFADDWTLTGSSVRVKTVAFIDIEVELMKAVWSIWFGKIDQPKLGDELIGKL
jgi:hypothetical protein